VVDVAGNPGTVKDVDLSIMEVAEEGTVGESATATCGMPFSLSVSLSLTTANVTDGSGGGDGGGVRISNAC
jgi:hypothetical protein